jgi:iron complex outermembrane receptor protein
VALSYNILKKDDLNWDATLTMAKNTMKIDKLSNDEYGAEAIPSGDLHGIRGMSNAYSQTIREGYSVGTFWGQKCSGLNEKGQFLNVNGDVLKAKDDSLNTDLGNAQPKFTLGFNTSVTYKDFDFSISTYGMFGQKVLNVTAMALNDNSRFPQYNVQHKMVEDSITSNATFSSYWIEDASFFRIQSVTMGYTFKFKYRY